MGRSYPRGVGCGLLSDSTVRMAREALRDARSDAELGIYVVPGVNGLAEPLTGQRVRDPEPLVDSVAPMLYHDICFSRQAGSEQRLPTSFRWPEARLCPSSRPIPSRSRCRRRLGIFNVGCRLERYTLRGCASA